MRRNRISACVSAPDNLIQYSYNFYLFKSSAEKYPNLSSSKIYAYLLGQVRNISISLSVLELENFYPKPLLLSGSFLLRFFLGGYVGRKIFQPNLEHTSLKFSLIWKVQQVFLSEAYSCGFLEYFEDKIWRISIWWMYSS